MTQRSAFRKGFAIALTAFFLAACSARASRATQVAIPSPTPAATSIPTPTPEETAQGMSSALADRYGFPTQIDPTKRYMFYMHGKIIEDQGLPAISPEYGEYQYEEILDTLKSYGFVIISELRPKDADGWEYAQRGASQVGKLLTAGVPPGSITVVGASKGATIATGVSYLVGNPDVNYVLLGTCPPFLIEQWKQQGVTLSGNVLAIRDVADDEYSGSCGELFNLSQGKGLSRHDEIVLHVGTGHGILYHPLPEWILPTIHWANQDW
jgi:hypothetical protein